MFFPEVSLRRRLLLNTLKIFDLAVLVFSFFASCFLLHNPQIQGISFEQFLAIRVTIQNLIIFVAIITSWHLFFCLCGAYHSHRLSPWWSEMHDLIKATLLGSVTLHLLAILFTIELVTIDFSVVFWGISCSAALLSRLLLRLALRQLRMRGRNLRSVLLVGTDTTAFRFARKIEEKKWLGYELIGFVANAWDSHGQSQLQGRYPLVTFAQFVEFLRQNVVDEVVICMPVAAFYPQYSLVIGSCEEQGIIVRFLTDVLGGKFATVRKEQFDDCSVITMYTGAMMGWPMLIKRGLDISLSLALLLVLAPVFALIALVIKVSSPGPVFFAQERVGLNKRRFKLIKFRTMVPDAEKRLQELEKFNEVSGPVFKIKHDPRVTPVGRGLRKTSLDELPQLFNVLKGDMSLVGPRPLPVRDYKGFDQDWQRRRFSVRPGITCLWQVEGRNSIPFERWMELDLYYIDHWSLWLDLKILLKTIPAVLKGSGS